MRKRILIALGILVGLIVVALVILPRLIDVNRYRGRIQSEAGAALGREVTLGQMRLSLFPVFGLRVDDVAIAALPGEGEGALLTARALRVGARLGPLLRKRLEVTSLVIEEPRLTLVRDGAGEWNVQQLLAADETQTAADATGTAPAFQVDRLRLSGGEIRIRDEYGRKPALELTLNEVDVELRDFALDRTFEYTVDLAVAELPASRVRIGGQAGPLASPSGEPLHVVADLDVEKLDLSRLAVLAQVPAELLGDAPASLAGRLEADFTTPARFTLSGLRLKGVQVALRRDAQGHWNLPDFGGEGEASAEAGARVEVRDLQVDDMRLSLRDETAEYGPLELALSDLRLRLDRLPTDGPATLDLQAELQSGSGGGELTVQGELGPLEGQSFPLALSIRAPTLPLAALRPLLGRDSGIDPERGSATLELKLNGDLQRSFEAVGSLGLVGTQVRLQRPNGSAATAPLDLQALFDMTIAGAGTDLDARKLEITIKEQRISIQGKVRQEGDLQQVDLELKPTRMRADDLAALLALSMGELPVTFASSTPVELEGRVRGRLGENVSPAIEGKARLADFTFRHPAMSQPIERAKAAISLRGETIEISELGGVVGTSDVAGRIRIEGFTRPAVSFELRSEKADLSELLSFLETQNEPAVSGVANKDDPLEGLTLNGSLRITQGSFGTLDFADLEATMRWADGVLALDPLSTSLYKGRYVGHVSGDLNDPQPLWTIAGQATDVDVQAFLADNADAPDLLSGRFTGEVATTTHGTDYESILRGLKGSGAVRVQEGRVGKLDVLKSLSKVSGVFGETTLKSLSGQLAQEGTDFSRLAGDLELEGGAMKIANLSLDSPSFRLTGQGRLDLLSADFRGQFRLILSQEISKRMRDEKSRAADLFWSSRTAQVEMPFGLSGPFDAPTPSVDFEAVARSKVKDKAEDKLRDLLGSKLGLSREPEAKPEAPAAPGATNAAEAAAAETPQVSSEITRTSWGGALLARDLRVEGVVRGVGITGARLVVLDARGNETRRIEPLPEVRAWLESGPDATQPAEIRFSTLIDGKRLALAKYPLRVVLVVQTGEQESEVTLTVDRL